jgi:hypothetical protein
MRAASCSTLRSYLPPPPGNFQGQPVADLGDPICSPMTSQVPIASTKTVWWWESPAVLDRTVIAFEHEITLDDADGSHTCL